MDNQTSAASWEYKVIKVGPSTAPRAEDVLNELGAAGWDLIVFQPAGGFTGVQAFATGS